MLQHGIVLYYIIDAYITTEAFINPNNTFLYNNVVNKWCSVIKAVTSEIV